MSNESKNVVQVNPGDFVRINLGFEKIGRFDCTRSLMIDYDELVRTLHSKKNGSSRRSKTQGSKFSRFVGLFSRAMETGVWSTGVAIDRNHITKRFLEKTKTIDPKEFVNITSKAIRSLSMVVRFESDLLDPFLLKELTEITNKIIETKLEYMGENDDK